MVVFQAVLIAGMLAGAQSVGESRPTSTSGKVSLVQQHFATLEASARQAKAKTAEGTPALSTLETQYADTVAAVDTWRTASVSATKQGWSGSRKRIEDLSKAAARAIATFARDARAFIAGGRANVDSRVVSLIESRLVDAAEVLAQADDETKRTLAERLSVRSWSELR